MTESWKSNHRLWMRKILSFTFKDPIAPYIGFTWWTALYFLYQLPRFSVDLDFVRLENCTDKIFDTYIARLTQRTHSQSCTLKRSWTIWSGHYFIYGWERKIKLDRSSFGYPNTYEYKDVLGLSMHCMILEDMFAHKLCALYARYKQREYIANRDIFDIQFLFELGVSPNPEIIAIRSLSLIGKKLSVKERYTILREFIIEHKDHIRKHILDGLWEMVEDQSTKHRLKQNLVDEVVMLLWVHAMQ